MLHTRIPSCSIRKSYRWISFVCFKLSTMGVLVITTHKRPCVEMSPEWVGAKPFIIIFLYKHNYIIFFKELL